MNKILVSVFSVVFLATASLGYAQTTASDWTKSDCDGTAHHLYSELDSGNVVVMDFAMTNCVPCATATTALAKIDEKFSVTHPGKLRHYGMGYLDQYSCDDMNSWKYQNGFTLPVMTQCAADVKFYGGMGMPTIVIVGGTDHKVLYRKQGFVPKDTLAMIQAIEKAFGSASVTSSFLANEIRVSGFGAEQSIVFSLSKPTILSIELVDMVGKVAANPAVNTLIPQEKYVLPLKTYNLHSGSYIVRISTKSGDVFSIPFSVVK